MEQNLVWTVAYMNKNRMMITMINSFLCDKIQFQELDKKLNYLNFNLSLN